MMFRRKGRAGTLFALAALLATEATPAQQPALPDRAAAQQGQQGPQPAIWLLEDADTRIYLFGTLHILPPGFRWRSPRFDAIASSADELVVEIADTDVAETMSAVVAEMELGKSAPILWRVSPDRRQPLQEMVDDLGIPIETFDEMQTWAAAMVLSALQIVRGMAAANGQRTPGTGEDAGSPPAPSGEAPDVADGVEDRAPLSIARMPGVEEPLVAQFRASNRPVRGVETAVQQTRFFRVLSFAEQRALLEGIVDAYDSGNAGTGIDGNIGQDEWARGDDRAMEAMTESVRGPLYEVLIRRRNTAWTDWLIDRLDRPGSLLFAVGAAHLAGEDSVRAMLAARGFTVRRIQ